MQISEIRSSFDVVTFFQQKDTNRNGCIETAEAEGLVAGDASVEPWELMEAVNRSQPTPIFTPAEIQEMRDANQRSGTMAYLGTYDQNFESQGINFHGDLYFTYFSNGQLKQATLTENETINGATYKADTIIIFDERGQVERGILASDSSVNGTVYKVGGVINFEEGQVTAGVLALDTLIQGVKYLAGSDIFYSREGQVSSGILAAGNTINGIAYPAETAVFFDASGVLIKVVPKEEIVLSGVRFRAGFEIQFFGSGQIASGVLEEDTTINDVVYMGGKEIRYFQNGRVESGTLAEAAEIGEEEYWEESQITFNEAGEVASGDAVDERYLRLQLQFPFTLSGGASWFNFRELGEGTLTVPPHAEDRGSATVPVNDTWVPALESGMTVDLMVDFWQYVYLRYRFGMVFKSDGVGDDNLDPRYQPYSFGENNSTFVQMQNIDDDISYHYLALGTDLVSHTYGVKGSGVASGRVSWSLELGAERQSYELVRGWMRNGQAEELDRTRFNMWGVALGTELRVISNTDVGFWGISFGINGAYFPDYGYNLVGTFGIPMGFKLFEK
jgi:hypothetical protein